MSGGQSSSVTQVGSGVGVTVGVDRSRQMLSTQVSPGGHSSVVVQWIVGVGVGAVSRSRPPAHLPDRAIVVGVHGTFWVGVGVGATVLVLVADGATVTLARM